MKSFKTFALERFDESEVKTYFLKYIGGVYVWAESTHGYGDIVDLPEDIKLLDFSVEIEGKKPYPVIIFTMPSQTFVRSL